MNGAEIVTEVIIFRGVVQGVGFRPTVYRIAQRLGMKGRVRNMGGAAQVVCTGTAAEIDAFAREIVSRKPPMARISGVTREVIGTVIFHEFSIGQSGAEEDEIAIIPADIAICGDCLREFYEPKNPRAEHPFISCASCGPRYTIMDRLPYDRDTTAMDSFEMCEFCAEEYHAPENRRYHAQTISCHDCGPQPSLLGRDFCGGTDTPTDAAIRILRGGGILALKGVGGYYLCCTPFDEGAVQRLRAIKRREQKPFAVLFRDVEQVREYCLADPAEAAFLTSPQRPIVLLEPRGDALFAAGVCNTSRFVGAFLPSFGLQYSLLDAAGPLIMTSANLSEFPLITQDAAMREMAARERGISGVLSHARRIAAGLDDSVARVIDGTPQLIRRAKGYVPAPVYVQAAEALTKDVMIFAAGGHLKSAFSVSKGAFAYISGHLGDMDGLESEALFAGTFARMKTFLDIEPTLAVCDMHPRYFPTRFAEALGLPLLRVQHHHAHVASVMAEHGLRGPVIGAAFDGTGYGTDGAIWGGEILICEGASFERFSHLREVDVIGGDASMKDAWKSAVSHLYALENRGAMAAGSAVGTASFEIGIQEIAAFCETNRTLWRNAEAMGAGENAETIRTGDNAEAASAALRSGINTVKTSSMGRLFDAACAMLGIHGENRYEGECAILLENAARRAQIKERFRETPTEQERLALNFHMDVCRQILNQCRLARDARSLSRVCLSGGVFQNKILMEETLRLLRADNFTVYYNTHVPPNDGGLALGQTFIGMMT